MLGARGAAGPRVAVALTCDLPGSPLQTREEAENPLVAGGHGPNGYAIGRATPRSRVPAPVFRRASWSSVKTGDLSCFRGQMKIVQHNSAFGGGLVNFEPPGESIFVQPAATSRPREQQPTSGAVEHDPGAPFALCEWRTGRRAPGALA